MLLPSLQWIEVGTLCWSRDPCFHRERNPLPQDPTYVLDYGLEEGLEDIMG